MIDQRINKAGQIIGVLGGFWLCMAFLIRGFVPGDAIRSLITAVFILSLALRYWWVILILVWPFRLTRMTLLLLVWVASASACAQLSSPQIWAYCLAAVAGLGMITEIYNTAQGAWQSVSAPLAATLLRDHKNGALAAGIGALGLFLAGLLLQPAMITCIAGLLTAADWLRLAEMVRRHRRLIGEGS